ncbi:TadE-like protein [Arthrobacter ulcerisalmonis]|uniref:TadE-like protein n=1 Tax=Arthrobacter ulcerisalmonis TaxID=2483813 RepID=A0A3P5X4P7_9MICC|nr:TadE-like protein [Arthrobacter ulcerisalmonis]
MRQPSGRFSGAAYDGGPVRNRNCDHPSDAAEGNGHLGQNEDGGPARNCNSKPQKYGDPSQHSGARNSESGAAVVDFVMVGSLLTVFFVAIVQLALVLHVRNTLIDAAASGARYGTLADRTAGDAEERTRALIGTALNQDFAAEVSSTEATYQGMRTLEIIVRAPTPVIGLIGPQGTLEVRGHAAIQR